MSIRSRAAALLAGVALVVLAGCATAVTPPPADPTASIPTPSVSESTAGPTEPAAAAGAEAIEGVRIGEPFASETEGLPGFVVVEGCEWVGTVSRGDYSLTVQRAGDSGEAGPVVLVDVSAAADAVPTTGPVTGEGIGIGSTLDEAMAAYPDARELAGVGDRRYLEVESGPQSSLFLSYTDGDDVVWALTATSLDLPPYEPCA